MKIIELSTDDCRSDDLLMRCTRMTISRVPAVGEIIRVLGTRSGMSTTFWFRVTEVVHNARLEQHPQRNDELDAWVKGLTIPEAWS